MAVNILKSLEQTKSVICTRSLQCSDTWKVCTLTMCLGSNLYGSGHITTERTAGHDTISVKLHGMFVLEMLYFCNNMQQTWSLTGFHLKCEVNLFKVSQKEEKQIENFYLGTFP